MAWALGACADFERGEPSLDAGSVSTRAADTGVADTVLDSSDEVAGGVATACEVTAPAWGLSDGLMLPGTDCLGCHASGQAATKVFTLAGTVFATRTCPQPATGAVVRVVDAAGVVLDLPVNAVGNFFTDRVLAPPWRVSLVEGDAITPMAAPTADGHCNRCHTPGASGYISLAKSATRLPATSSSNP